MSAGELLALSVRQPWAWAIVQGYKPVENRSWWTAREGPFLIHAAKGMTRAEFEDFLDTARACGVPAHVLAELRPEDLPRGGIVGRANLRACVDHHPSPWFFGRWGFVLSDVQALPFRPCRGSLGFFQPDFGPDPA